MSGEGAAGMPLSDPERRAFIGPNADYYLTRWTAWAAGESATTGFNWAAFFFNMPWLLYRRMYHIFGLVFVGSYLIGLASTFVVERFLELPLVGYQLLLRLIVALTIGSFGNFWYLRHTEQRISAAKDGEAPRLEQLGALGGVHWWPPLLYLGFLLLNRFFLPDTP